MSNQYVWSADGNVQDLVLRDDNSTSGGFGKTGSGLGERLYVQQDANHDVTAITDTSGNVKQRFIEDPYGAVAVLSPTWANATDAYSWTYGFQGGRVDPVTGLYHFGARDYSPALGRWMQMDPAGYVEEGNIYQVESSNPVDRNDPSGLWQIVAAFEGFGGYPKGTRYGNTIPGTNGLSGSWVQTYWEEPVRAGGKHVDWHYYPEFGQNSAFNELIRLLTKNSDEEPCKYDTLIILGFSNGGEAAYQLATKLNNSHIRVDAVFTADPVPKFAQGGWRPVKPPNVEVWENFYQKHDGHFRGLTLQLIQLRGLPVAGASPNQELRLADFAPNAEYGFTQQQSYDVAHFNGEILRAPTVLSHLGALLQEIPDLRSSYETGSQG